MWILYAILVHTALLGSIFVIYFRSPVITGLHPQEELENPPAKRLVLIVTDGLRAESFFKNQCGDIPHIRQLISQQGLVGISQTRVPTESRPGHIALIAGLYEDPSAVLRGWKANPIDFDNVFNRSSHTYAWGAMDVLHIFSKITAQDMIDAYDEYDFTGTDDSWMVDQWVFERVRRFLSRKAEELRPQKRSVFFLHLLGLDIVSLISSEGSDSEKEDSTSIEESQTARAPSLRKTGKSVSFQENEQSNYQMAVKEFPHMFRRGSIAPLAARLRSNRPPTAPPVSIFLSDYENCTVKMSEHEKITNKDDLPNTSLGKENNNFINSSSSIESTVECDFPEYVRSIKERECWKLFQKMSKKGVTVTYDTILRGMLTPTEFRQLQKQREFEDAKAKETEQAEPAANNTKNELLIIGKK